ncbi:MULTISPECIES: SusC/RagA family TonB-linked outer membrane protein [Olivibacter]|uniref:SusC/RagA family TonB-linked outer membrane protein n=1 Tax=Olivibacter oleidegradans TaxID=760123 RepID=A0ABV6HJZ0_9SPHI|nr:SusC/RagA family TonB-linked outer membrane protein [Olivibacter sp. LS-1]QEL00693.1 SusC/RagA family TonB-linked outer membrane protein [Olivibacter sp. LS-1]
MNNYLYRQIQRWRLVAWMFLLIGFQPLLSFANRNADPLLNKRISVNLHNASLKEALDLLTEKTGIAFVYSDLFSNRTERVNINAKNISVREVLDKMINASLFSYTVMGKEVVINAKTKQQQIRGLVTDQTKAPLPGVSVRIKGTNQGTSTNEDGRYGLTAPADATLVFSFTGYVKQEIPISGRNVIDIQLNEDNNELNEVVVTALGVRKERKALGYAVTEVKGEEITTARENNFVNSLAGKVAGLDIGATSGGVGAASNVIIRGVSSIGQGNQPLYVINGVPMESKPVGRFNTNPNGNSGSQWDNAPDMGDAISNLNPDDIETISVLKGAAASALYGYRAKAGVIMITTKSGKGNSIDFSSNYVAEQVMNMTDWQYVYGQGSNNAKPIDQAGAAQVGGSSWGARLDGSQVVQFDGVERPYVAQRDNLKNFYRTGGSWTNTLALNKSFDFGTVRLSGSNLDNRSVVPNSGMDRQTFNFSGVFDPIKNLKIDARVNYIMEDVQNRPYLSDGAGNANYNVTFLPTSVNVTDLKPWVNADGTERAYNAGNTFATNPWFAAYEFRNNTKRERTIGSITARYDFDSGYFIQGRVGRDNYSNKYTNVVPSGTAYRPLGSMTEQITLFSDLNADFLAGGSFSVDDFVITPAVGAAFRRTKSELSIQNGQDFSVAGLYNILNTVNKTVGFVPSDQETQSVYGNVEFSYRDMLYLTGSLRSDWFSTLATPGIDNKLNTVYPSVNASFVFSELWQPSFLSFGKVRLGYATVGQATDPYRTQLMYNFLSETLNGKPLGNIINTAIPNSGLKASSASELEFGAELSLFDSRLNVDVSYYNKQSKDEIVDVTTSTTTGYLGAVLNVGEMENKGVELLLTGHVFRNPDGFNWTTSFNGTLNNNKIKSLAEGTTVQPVATSRSNVGFLQHREGLPAFQIMAFDFSYDENGNIMYLPNGAPVRGELKPYGSAMHKWMLGWNNEFRYKNLNFSFLIDSKWGGKIFSATDYYGYIFGLHQATLENREGSFGESGVEASEYYSQYANNVSKQFVQDASFIKLRQIVIGYTFPSAMFNNKIKSLNISAVARNPFILMRRTDNIDPEASYNASIPGLELGGVPPIRTFGLNLSARF